MPRPREPSPSPVSLSSVTSPNISRDGCRSPECPQVASPLDKLEGRSVDCVSSCLFWIGQIEEALSHVRGELHCIGGDGSCKGTRSGKISICERTQDDGSFSEFERSPSRRSCKSISFRSTESDGQLQDNIVKDQILNLKGTTTLDTAWLTRTHSMDLGISSLAAPKKGLISLIHPEANGLVAWLIFGLIFVCFDVLACPVLFAFDITITTEMLGLFIVASCGNVYFLLDVVLVFCTGFRDKQGTVNLDPRDAAIRYMSTWLVFDVVSAIPWDWIGEDTAVANLRVMRVFRLTRCVRLTRILKLLSLSSRSEGLLEMTFLSRYLGLINLASWLLVMIHYLACFWYFLGMSDAVQGDVTWVTTYLDGDTFGGPQRSVSEGYLVSVYFVLTTMTTVGYGDISPQNSTEIVFGCIVLLLSSFTFGSLTGHIMGLISQLNRSEYEIQERKAALKRYMHWRCVPLKLRTGIKKYLTFLWEQNRGNELVEKAVVAELSPFLRKELFYHIRGEALKRQPFLAWMSECAAPMKFLSSHISEITLGIGDFLFRIGQPNVECFVLLSGKVWLTQTVSLEFSLQKGKNVASFAPGTSRPLSLPRKKSTVQMTDFSFGWPAGSDGQSVEDRADFVQQRHFGNPLTKAAQELAKEDMKLALAAKALQRGWKNHVKKRNSESVRRKDNFTSFRVVAPAHFGESCLWVPMEEWGTSKRNFSYSARCETRSEALVISRDVVNQTCKEFSPWLEERFNKFREMMMEQSQDNAYVS
eukprot:TRINITY_DN51270_c0_g1_i1.p1 TRINITY_DN51270_c0_g1~~TRINITY_DN51270_c0_g1_i1.p1  ORF type:complete len:758 (-),score=118.57 TRINITY_DN51270_c0_g1_i1:111-2384(-)